MRSGLNLRCIEMVPCVKVVFVGPAWLSSWLEPLARRRQRPIHTTNRLYVLTLGTLFRGIISHLCEFTSSEPWFIQAQQWSAAWDWEETQISL